MQVWVYGALLVVILVLFKKSEGYRYKITTNGYDEYYGKDLAYLGFLGPTVTHPNVTACKKACDSKSGCVGFTVSRNKSNSNQRSCQMKARPTCAEKSPHTCNKYEGGRLQRKNNVRDFMIRNYSRTAFVNRNFRYEIMKPAPAAPASPAPTPAAPAKTVQGTTGRGGVTVNADAKFKGASKQFYSDELNADMKEWKKRITSIKVPARTVAILYKGAGHTGESLTLVGPRSFENIGVTFGAGWNDSVESMKISSATEGSSLWNSSIEAMNLKWLCRAAGATPGKCHGLTQAQFMAAMVSVSARPRI
jgi:hypothetical protein